MANSGFNGSKDPLNQTPVDSGRIFLKLAGMIDGELNVRPSHCKVVKCTHCRSVQGGVNHWCV